MINKYQSGLVHPSLTDSTLPCFAAFGDQTVNQLRERFQPSLTHSLVGEYVDRLVDSSLDSNWTRLYDLVSVRSILLVASSMTFPTIVPILFAINSLSLLS